MKEKIIETIKKFSHYHATGGERCLWENRWNEVAAEIEAALIWHGPDEVPPYSIRVEDKKGRTWRHINGIWFILKNGVWHKGIHLNPPEWRYPAPIKKQDGGQAGE